MSKMHNLFYDSPKEFFEDVAVRPNYGTPEYKGFRRGGMNKNEWERLEKEKEKSSFHGNFDDCYNRFKKHDVKSEASVMADIMDEINCAEFTERAWEYRQRLEEGDIIDVNRYLDGHEKFWCEVRRSFRTKQVVRVYVGCGGNYGRSKEELAVCGAVAVTLCEILESMGIGVELWSVYSVSDLFTDGDHGETLIRLKASDEFADLGMVNFMAGDSTVFRNGVFRSWVKLAERDDKTCDSGLGRIRVFDKDDIGLSDDEADACIIVPQIFNVERARTWLKDLISNLSDKTGGKKKEEE